MCFYIHKDHTEPKVATRSIRVWKRFEKSLVLGDGSILLISPYPRYGYKAGETYELGGPLVALGSRTIEKGFHAHDSMAYAVYRVMNSVDTDIVIECTVPKGATYYWNPYKNEIVSDQLLIKAIKPTRQVKTGLSFPARAKKTRPVWAQLGELISKRAK